jgi:S1-C subfamily serine protease
MAAKIEDVGAALVKAVAAARQGVVGITTSCARLSGTVWSDGKTVLTSARGVRGEERVTVLGDSGDERTAKVVGRDAATDLAALEVEGDAIGTPLAAVDAAGVSLGQLVVALGRPGRSARASLRMIGVAGDDVELSDGTRLERYLETDRAIVRGFTGGPLIDLAGGLVGVQTRYAVRGADLAIAKPTIERVVPALRTHGSVPRGYLGVGVYGVALPAAAAGQLGRSHGALVVAVESGGPADRAGILVGDILVTVAGQAVRGPRELRGALAARVGERAPVEVVRAGAVQTVEVEIGARA